MNSLTEPYGTDQALGHLYPIAEFPNSIYRNTPYQYNTTAPDFSGTITIKLDEVSSNTTVIKTDVDTHPHEQYRQTIDPDEDYDG